MKNKVKYLTAAALVLIAAGLLFFLTPIAGFTQVRDGTPPGTDQQAARSPVDLSEQGAAGLGSLQA